MSAQQETIDLLNEALDAGEKMAKLLQDCIDEATEAGSSLSEFQEVLDEWNEAWEKSGRGWKKSLKKTPILATTRRTTTNNANHGQTDNTTKTNRTKSYRETS